MNEIIAALLTLQELDIALESLRRDKEAVLPLRAQIQNDQKKLVASFEESKKALLQAQVDRKKLEGETEAKDQAIRKHTSELNAVKGNDAYRALLSEIETAKSEKASIEDRILEVMELQDRLQKELAARESTLSADKAALEKKAAELDAAEKSSDQAIIAKTAERDVYVGPLPPDALRRYETVRRGRSDFSALAEAKGMTCLGCRTHLPPDVVNQVMKGTQVVLCETCSRILFIRPEPKPATPA